ncbi:jg14264 [Pararge aegeria aegeria]|uniref:Jg14264 protein n=1 Tax=Pararge aegeria aegeria TaxID=348720 RepID=A0A8S4QY25_9NEOP|nr:jg14264 [Pararge aegeria aegeria]
MAQSNPIFRNRGPRTDPCGTPQAIRLSILSPFLPDTGPTYHTGAPRCRGPVEQGVGLSERPKLSPAACSPHQSGRLVCMLRENKDFDPPFAADLKTYLPHLGETSRIQAVIEQLLRRPQGAPKPTTSWGLG